MTWTDPEALAKSVDEYFANESNWPTTWTGLALHLGFASRDSLNDYMKKEGFSDPIKKALLRVENQYEKGLFGRNPAGAIFALKNFKWKDKQEVDHHVEGEWNISMNVNGKNTVRTALDAGVPDKDN